ncbi:MAG TPA: glycosyltransferase family 4 protein, partial [Candidatus Binataceae bacterium]|nr:glycosyltransferase family 4 protein [Candidatus Binataceae bacterium]
VHSTHWTLIAEGFHRRGGMEKANAALASYLSSQGIPVKLVAFSVDPELRGKPGVSCTIAAAAGRRPLLGRLYLAQLGHSTASESTAKSPSARVLVNGINCRWSDINWVHWLHQCWRAPVHGAPFWFRLKQHVEMSRASYLERTAFRRTRLIIANSERTKRDLVELIGVSPARIHTIYLGTDWVWKKVTPDRRAAARSWLQIPPNRPLVAFVGALGYDLRKGFDVLWRAWTDLCRLPEWDGYLVVAGHGRTLSNWRRVASDSGLGARIRFLGFTSRIPDVLAASDLLVSPARYESYGLNVQEALSCGIPSIVSASAGVAERYKPELSPLLLPNSEDSRDLVARILRWRQDMPGWIQRVQPTMKMLRNYTWDDMSRRMVTLAEVCKTEPKH